VRGEVVLKNPSNEEVAACLGMNQVIDDVRVRDVIIVGRTSGLAAAFTPRARGSMCWCWKPERRGQAGSSSKSKIIWGFPTGIPGSHSGPGPRAGTEIWCRDPHRPTRLKLNCERKSVSIELGMRTKVPGAGHHWRPARNIDN